MHHVSPCLIIGRHGYRGMKNSDSSEIWAPSAIGNITKIESLQRRATKFILNMHWQEDISYHERLSRLNLLPLTYWHKVKDVIFYFKCRAGHYTLPIDDYVKPLVSLATALIKTYLFPSTLQSSFNLVTLIALLNSGIRYLNPLVLLVLLISLNLTYSNAIRLLFVQTMTSLADLLQMQ